jgi:NAD+ synthase (glutamine-hydrolysing)
MSVLRIALAQIDGTVGDLPGNAARIGELIGEARERGADLVVFPQLALPGYPPGDLLRRSAFLAANEVHLAELATRVRGVSAVVGCIGGEARDWGQGVALHDSAAILRDGVVAGTYARRVLPTGEPLDGVRFFTPGRTEELFQLAGHRIGITIGAEILSDGVVASLARAGAELIINLGAYPFEYGERRRRRRELVALAREYGIALACVDRVGAQDELIFEGGSIVLGGYGEILAEARTFEEELLICELQPKARTEAGRTLARGKASPAAAIPDASGAATGPAHTAAPPSDEDLGAIYQALTSGIRGYARKNGFSRVTLGLSGGLDSALVATLAADALGPEAVTALWLPSRYSSELSRSDAVALAHLRGIELLTIPIERAFQALLETVEPHFAGRAPDITEENLQARVRGNILMALSNKFGWLVLATSNKSETAVGYSTLYGDSAGGLAPLKDLYKTLVFRLARWRNEQGQVIPRSTIERPPTAELRPEQLDTDSLPPYDLLDMILGRYLEGGWSAAQLVAAGAEEGVVQRVLGLVDRGEYKRRQTPPALKVTPYTFGVDDMMPMTSRFREV